MTEFNIYQPDTQTTSIVIGVQDPQREEVLRAIAAVFHEHKRATEEDKCLHAIGWEGAV